MIVRNSAAIIRFFFSIHDRKQLSLFAVISATLHFVCVGVRLFMLSIEDTLMNINPQTVDVPSIGDRPRLRLAFFQTFTADLVMICERRSNRRRVRSWSLNIKLACVFWVKNDDIVVCVCILLVMLPSIETLLQSTKVRVLAQIFRFVCEESTLFRRLWNPTCRTPLPGKRAHLHVWKFTRLWRQSRLWRCGNIGLDCRLVSFKSFSFISLRIT